jgi:hypothetical protein
MPEFRYSAASRDLEDALTKDLQDTVVDKTTAEERPAESGLDRIAKISAASEVEVDAGAEIREHRARQKLAEIKTRGPRLVEEFLGAKDRS